MNLRFLLLVFVLSAPLSAGAQVNSDELQAVEQQLKERAEEEKRLRQEAAARQREVAALRNSMIETANSIQESERKVVDLEESIEQLEGEKAEAETALNVESANLSEVLAALQSLEMSRPPALLVSPEDANKAARAAIDAMRMAPEEREAIDRLAALAEELARDRASFTRESNALAARRDVLAELVEKKEKERDVAQALAASAQRETARIAAEASTLRGVIERLSRLAHLITPRLKPPAPLPAATPPTSTPNLPSVKRTAPAPVITAKAFGDALGALRAPVAGRLTGDFGKPRPEGGVFEGLRFSVRNQAIVTAPFEGRVAFAQDWQPVGNMIVLDVGEGYHILLIGVGRILVEEHQKITAGEPVAEMAGGGAALDLEIRKNGEPVNPALWLSRKTMESLR